MKMEWFVKSFKELNTTELYKILQLRAEIFVVEQNSPYQDLDGKDLKSFHLMCFSGEDLVAYTRLLPKNVSYAEASIGRVVTSGKVRGKGVGRELMNRSINELENLYGKGPIRIGAQLYLQKFYESFGFVREGESYLEDTIPHIKMLRT
jgi:ElaA protein